MYSSDSSTMIQLSHDRFAPIQPYIYTLNRLSKEVALARNSASYWPRNICMLPIHLIFRHFTTFTNLRTLTLLASFHQTPVILIAVYAIIILASQMTDMNALFASAMTASLVPGSTYLIMNAQRIPTKNGMRLYVKLRAAPQNIFCKLPGGLAYLFTDYHIDQINNDRLCKLIFLGEITIWVSDYTDKERCPTYAYF